MEIALREMFPRIAAYPKFFCNVVLRVNTGQLAFADATRHLAVIEAAAATPEGQDFMQSLEASL